MSTHDLFEQRATSAGAALRAAFTQEDTMTTTTTRTTTTTQQPATAAAPPGQPHRRRPGRVAAAAAALASAAAVVGVLAVTTQDDDPADVLTPRGERERAVLAPPFLTASGTLPDAAVHAVQDVPVPFTFADPPVGPSGREWLYRIADGLVDLNDRESGVELVAPTQTYDPDRPWQGQSELQPAPATAAEWGSWLEQTGHVEVLDRTALSIGGAPAVRYALDVGELPAGYDGCGGGRTCIALTPMLDPSVGTARAGTGPQVGLTDETAELTAVEVDGRVVLALAGGEQDTTSRWLPVLRELVASLRFR